MEISGIQGGGVFNFTAQDKTANTNRAQILEDKVNLQGVQILADEEVEGVYNDTIGLIGTDTASALSVHGGLSESRIFALLDM